jgi:hypothetical protein
MVMNEKKMFTPLHINYFKLIVVSHCPLQNKIPKERTHQINIKIKFKVHHVVTCSLCSMTSSLIKSNIKKKSSKELESETKN